MDVRETMDVRKMTGAVEITNAGQVTTCGAHLYERRAVQRCGAAAVAAWRRCSDPPEPSGRRVYYLALRVGLQVGCH